jgi:transcriptional regulator with XRE-family HTH domain
MSEYNIGVKLKKLRLAKKLTLQSVADEIGFSPALISQIENNNVSPPIATLSRLAKFLGVRMSTLFAESDNEPRFEVIRKDDRKAVSKVISRGGSRHGYCYESFSFRMQNRKISPFLITLSGRTTDDNTYSDEGESFVYVVKGKFELQLDNRLLVLEEGDSVYFDASLEHRFHSMDGSEVTILEVKGGTAKTYDL